MKELYTSNREVLSKAENISGLLKELRYDLGSCPRRADEELGCFDDLTIESLRRNLEYLVDEIWDYQDAFECANENGEVFETADEAAEDLLKKEGLA